MNNKLLLSIAVTSAVCINASSAAASISTSQAQPLMVAAADHNGGKCASGKCGTEKRFEKQTTVQK